MPSSLHLAAIAALVTACATSSGAIQRGATHGVAPHDLLPFAIDAARAQHFEVALVRDRVLPLGPFDRNAMWQTDVGFVALPAREPGATLAVAYVVRISPTSRGWRADARADANVLVTPLAFERGHAIPDEQVPADVRTRAASLLAAIEDRATANRAFY